MLRVWRCQYSSCATAKEAYHWNPMNRYCSLEIYQKWYSAVNEKAMASPLPIHHQWCIADKLLGSNKPLLRGWPHWWKQKLPHGHPSIHSPRLFDTTVSACLCTRELISTLLLLGGGVCPCTLTEKNKHTICLQTWGSKSASALRQRWKVESKGLFSQHAADVRLYLPLQTAPGFISCGRWQIDRGRAHVLGGFDANIWRWHTASFPFLSFFFLLSKDQHRKACLMSSAP